MSDLDDRIRSLVAAVADAAPGPPALPSVEGKPERIRWRGPLVAGLAFAIALAVFLGLSRMISTLPTQPISTPPTEPISSPPTEPVLTETTLLPASNEPSQSEADAARDGVLPDIAALPYSERVVELLRVEADEGFWVLSRMPRIDTVRHFGECENQGRDCIYGIDMATDSDYAELLLLDPSGRIVKAYPMAGMPPSWIYLDDEFLFGGRIGDGGLPDSTVFRIGRQSRSLTGVYLVAHVDELNNEGWYPWTINSGLLPGWTLSQGSWGPYLSISTNDLGGVQVESWIGVVFVDLDRVKELLVFPEDF